VDVSFVEEGNSRLARIEREIIAYQENINPSLTSKSWLQKYTLMDQYQIFFASFLIELKKWISRLTERKTYFKGGEHTMWTPKLIK